MTADQLVAESPTVPRRPAQRTQPPKGSGGGRTRAAIRVPSNTLDIRGRRASEIEADLGRAVDKASSLGTLWVIHGHGTGALKQRVRELLSEEPAVVKCEDAPQEEGGSGCTVAFLR